jgi:hypothetical protein
MRFMVGLVCWIWYNRKGRQIVSLRKCLWWLVVAGIGVLLMALLPSVAWAAVIPPSAQPVVSKLINTSIAQSKSDRPSQIAIQGSRIEIYWKDQTPHTAIWVYHPEESPGNSDTSLTALAPGIYWKCLPGCEPKNAEKWRGFARVLAKQRDLQLKQIWVPVTDDRVVTVSTRHEEWKTYPIGLQKGLAWLTIGYLLGWTLFRGFLRFRTDPWWWKSNHNAWIAGIIALSVLLSLSLTDGLPLHDHNSFVARSDCCYTMDCTQSPRGAWSLTTFYVYGLLLKLFPYKVVWLGRCTLFVSTLNLLIFSSFVRRLFGHVFDEQQGKRIALWALALLALNPIYLRLATGGTLWPYALLMLWTSLLLGWLAVRSPTPAVWLAWLAASSLTVQSSWVFLGLFPLMAICYACWSPDLRSRKAGIWLVLSLLSLVLLALPTLLLVATLVTSANARVGAGNAWFKLQGIFRHQMLWDWRLFPVVMIPLVVAALLRLPKQGKWVLPLFFAFCMTEYALANQVNLVVGYPTRFLHGHSSLYFTALAAAVGVENIRQRWTWAASRTAALLTAAGLLVSAGLCQESIVFLHQKRVLSQELAQLSKLFPELPNHAVLLVAPDIQTDFKLKERNSDPVEAFFPQAEYSYVRQKHGWAPAKIVTLDTWLQKPTRLTPDGDTMVLVYVGVTLKSFVKDEIREGVVPDTLERPLLTKLRTHYRLQPVKTFQQSTKDNPKVAMRLAADRAPSVELGFYRLVPLPPSP